MWRPASEPPKSEIGSCTPVIIARQKNGQRWYVFGAWYLNAFPLDDCNDIEDTMLWTGFHHMKHHDDYDEFFEPVNDVLYWQPMPAPPEHCEHGIQDGEWCEPCNREYKLAAVENRP